MSEPNGMREALEGLRSMAKDLRSEGHELYAIKLSRLTSECEAAAYPVGVEPPSIPPSRSEEVRGYRISAEQVAQQFHETYERLAPTFGYETRKASAVPWGDVPEKNKRLMIAVCAELVANGDSDQVDDVPITFCKKTLYCGKPENHEGACDDIPF